MNSNLTDLTLVVDRSGSMETVRTDAEGGVNAFIKAQTQEPGDVLLTLVQFDTEYEFVHSGVPIAQVPDYTLVPRGMTALLDAVGRAINETGERLAKLEEKERPGLVIFVVMTDGMENSSREFTKPQIKKLIKQQQDRFQWHFTFLGANQDAFEEADAIGIRAGGAADYAMDRVQDAYMATSNKVRRMRAQRRSGETVNNDFTDEERDQMK